MLETLIVQIGQERPRHKVHCDRQARVQEVITRHRRIMLEWRACATAGSETHIAQARQPMSDEGLGRFSKQRLPIAPSPVSERAPLGERLCEVDGGADMPSATRQISSRRSS
jgi:hypothetical protein